MTNGEKYKSIKERLEKFRKWCYGRSCDNCKFGLDDEGTEGCVFVWLEMECNEELEPCPFCGSDEVNITEDCTGDGYYVHCERCDAKSSMCYRKENAVNAWNRRV